MRTKTRAFVAAIFLFILTALFFSPQQTFAEVGESIKDYNAVLTVAYDGTLHVTETIVYDPAGAPHHGIYRDIRLQSAYGSVIEVRNVAVHDVYGGAYEFILTESGSTERIKIGNPNITFVDPHTYVIDYDVVGALASLDTVDELYWNVTGNTWAFPIMQSAVRIVLPNGITIANSTCYMGYTASNARCGSMNSTDSLSNTVTYTSPRSLASGEGLTVAVDFPKGSITIPSPIASPYNPLTIFFYIVALVLPTGIVLLLLHHIRSKIPGSGHRVIIPVYDVPDDLTPLEMKTLVEPMTSNMAIPAEIIYLATKGYISISRVTKKMIIGSTVDHELHLLKGVIDTGAPVINNTDMMLIGSIFTDTVGTVVLLSSLRGRFWPAVVAAQQATKISLAEKGYVTEDTTAQLAEYSFCGTLIIIVIGLFTKHALLGAVQFNGVYGEIGTFFMWGILPAAAIFVLGKAVIIPFTEKGAACRDAILGFKDYLDIAEKDRINFANAPEKNPTTFEKFLPYAMALGVEKAWGKEFADITMEPPQWYNDTTMSSNIFNSTNFIHSLSSFGTAMRASGTSPSHAGGGGGFSGGGGGGGGGGSW